MSHFRSIFVGGAHQATSLRRLLHSSATQIPSRPTRSPLLTFGKILFGTGATIAGWTVLVAKLHQDYPSLTVAHGYLGIFITQAIAFPATLIARSFWGADLSSEMKEKWMGRALYGWMHISGIWQFSFGSKWEGLQVRPDGWGYTPVPEIVNQDNQHQSFVIVSNHSSYADNIALTFVPVPKRFLTNSRYYAIPVFGWTQYLAGDVPVNLSSPQSKRESVERCHSVLTEDHASIVIYPEGTRTQNPPTMSAFKSGAFRIAQGADREILPVVLRNTHKAMGKNCDCHPAQMEVVVLPPIGIKGMSIDEAMAIVHQRIAHELSDQ
jgi:1-acyl-sn-glycerol-3-phosphate acyltransferase